MIYWVLLLFHHAFLLSPSHVLPREPKSAVPLWSETRNASSLCEVTHAPQVTHCRRMNASTALREVRTRVSGVTASAPAQGQVTTRRAGGAQSEKGGGSSVALTPPTASSIKLAAHSPSRIPEGAKISQNVLLQVYGSGLLGYPRGEWALASPDSGTERCRRVGGIRDRRADLRPAYGVPRPVGRGGDWTYPGVS